MPPSLCPIRPMRDLLVEWYRLQEFDRGQGVAGEVLARGERSVPRRAADAPVVKPQHGDAAARQVVSQDQERLVPGDGFVAVLLPGTRDEDHHGIRFGGTRRRQRSGQLYASRAVLNRHFVGEVRVWRLRFLRPWGGDDRWLASRVALQGEGQLTRTLREPSLDGRAVLRQRSGERRIPRYSRNRKANRGSVDRNVRERPGHGALRRNIDRPCPRSGRGAIEPDGNLEHAGRQVDRAFPEAAG